MCIYSKDKGNERTTEFIFDYVGYRKNLYTNHLRQKFSNHRLCHVIET